MGIQTGIEVLDTSWIDPPEHIRERLNVGDDQKVLRIEKLRSIEGSPFSHVYNYLPEAIGKKLPTEMAESKPMLVILEEDLGIRVAEADQSVQATIADADMASILKVRVGEPLLKAERTIYDVRGIPVEYVSVRYRADKYAFTVKLKRRKIKASAGWDAE